MRGVMKLRKIWPLAGVLVIVLLMAMTVATSSSARAKTIKKSRNTSWSPSCPWLNSSLSVSQRLRILLPKLTLSDKIALVHGVEPSHGYGGYMPGIPNLCIPALKFQDGPAGVGDGATGVTALPAPVAAAATWNLKLVYQYGKVIGEEAKVKGINVIFGPMVNIVRDPRWGRAWETFGEDPYLNGMIGVAEIKGIQSQKVIATVKHVAAYDQDQSNRGDSIVGVRALHEIYLPAFQMAIARAKVGAAMATGGEIDNVPANENAYLLKNTLKQGWGFQGFITSDYDGARSPVGSANAGLDLSMPSPGKFGVPLFRAVKDGRVSISELNRMVSSMLREEFRFGLFNNPNAGSMQTIATSPADTAVATEVAEQSTVLLKNSRNQLPLKVHSVGSIAVIGAAGSAYPKAVGCGSGQVNPPYVVSPIKGIRALVGSRVTVMYAQGSNPPDDPNPVDPTRLIANAVAAAKEANVAIVFASDLECEGGGKAYGPAAPPVGSVSDRRSISLSGDQDKLISAIAAVNPHTVVVLNTGAPVAAPWLTKVSALLEVWYPGQVDGNAIASVLFGDIDPSGHTVQTWPDDEQQMPTANAALWGRGTLWPGVGPTQQFSNNLLVGYRYYDAHHITPLFPFGYGLSYTTFAYSHLRMTVVNKALSSPKHTIAHGNRQSIRMVEVSAMVTNTGTVAGADVAQLYLGDPKKSGEPPRQLKGFDRIFLRPSQAATVHFILTIHDLSYWKDFVNGWTIPIGVFRVFVGDSSSLANLPLRSTFTVTSSMEVRLPKL